MNESTAERATTGFEIRVRGILGERLLGAFPDLVPIVDHGDTVLVGRVLDQSALHGVLARVEALGLELLEVRRPSAGARPPRLLSADRHARADER